MRKNLYFELAIEDALLATAWTARHFNQLRGQEPDLASRELLFDLSLLATEVERLLEGKSRLRKRRTGDLHVLQAQVLLRLEALTLDWSNVRILEVGAEKGALVRELQSKGAQVLALDIDPLLPSPLAMQGDFMASVVPDRYDVIVATGVFETGSCIRGEPEAVTANLTADVLDRMRQLLRPGGYVVLENAARPLPFTQTDAQTRGFEVVWQNVPEVNLHLGGRSCCLHLPHDRPES
ncbi:MAG: class I SAM-dependent methyltransferase [Myxococcaceae bacterium]